MRSKWGQLGAVILAAFIFAVMAVTPPAPKSAAESPYHFSSARAMEDVRVIAANPHPTGSAENAKVRDYLVARMTQLGMEVSQSESRLGERALKRLNKWSGEEKTEQAIFNVIGILPGTDRSKPALLLMAHHDTVWGSPGAADDTIGIASIFEIIRAVNAQGQPGRDIIVLLTDGEEVGLSGARNFFKANPLHQKVGAVINFEARGGGGTVNMFQTSPENGAAVRLFAKAVTQPSTSSLSTFVYSILPNDTDLTPALEKDYTAYNLANLGRAEYYHSPKIDASALSEATLQHMGSQGLDLTQALISEDVLPEKKDDATFFDLFGLVTVIFAAAWGWGFLILGGGLLAIAYNRSEKRAEILNGAARMIIFIVAGGALLTGLNKISGNHSGANYYDRLADINKLEIVAGLLCVSVFFAIFGHKTLSENARIGAAIPIFALGIAGQAIAPTASYFITLPVLMVGVAAFLRPRWPESKFSAISVMIMSALVAGYMLGLGHLLMLGVGPNMLGVAILPAAIGALALLPLYPGVSKAVRRNLSVITWVLAAALALWIRLDPVAITVPIY